MEKIFLTGTSGFIGYHVAGLLLKSGLSVVSVLRPASTENARIQSLKSNGLEIIKGDFYSNEILDVIFSQRIDGIIHLAAIRGETNISDLEYKRVNLLATETLLLKARQYNVPRFIYCSSVGVLGTIPEKQPAAVDHTPRPDNRYHQSKWDAEQLVNDYHKDRLTTCILRPTVTYGSGDNGFLPKLVAMVNKRQIPVVNPAPQIHMLHVKSLANLILELIKQPKLDGETYIVADLQPVPLDKLVDRIAEISSSKTYPRVFKKVPLFLYKIMEKLVKINGNLRLLTSIQLIGRSWTYDISKTVQELNYQPDETFSVINETIKEILHAGQAS